MTDTNPITPPPELKQQWLEQASRYSDGDVGRKHWLIERASEWGYDQRGEVNEAKLQKARDEELEACCELLKQKGVPAWSLLRTARRPKPPSLKEQALMALEDGDTGPGASLTPTEVSIIRRALEALPDD